MRWLIVALCMATTPVMAQESCVSTETFPSEMKKHKYKNAGVGTVGADGIVQIIKKEDGNFMIILHRPMGLSCVMARGSDWQPPKEEPKEIQGERL